MIISVLIKKTLLYYKITLLANNHVVYITINIYIYIIYSHNIKNILREKNYMFIKEYEMSFHFL